MNKTDLERIRRDFPALQQERNGKPMIYFDNACMTLKPTQVITAMNRYYYNFPACGGYGRSAHWFAKRVNNEIYRAREKIMRLINARPCSDSMNLEKTPTMEVVFTKNTTESINLVAKSISFKKDAVVLTTDKEHNSNLCPWKELEKKGIIRHLTVHSNPDNSFNMESFKKILKENNVQLVSMIHTSNIDGYTIPAREIIEISHKHGARVLLDSAQSIPHKVLDVQELDVDFLAFSVHKMCGPSGMGVLYGKEEHLNDKEFGPFMVGGDTVNDTYLDKYPEYLLSPFKFEAGLQNYSGIIGTGAAADYLSGIGMENIEKHEYNLNKFLTDALSDYKEEFDIIGPQDPSQRCGIITLWFKRRDAVRLNRERFLKETGHLWDIFGQNDSPPAENLSGIDSILNGWNNIMVRSGEFCVHSWFNAGLSKFHKECSIDAKKRQTVRISLYIYNTIEECKLFVETLEKIMRLPEYTNLSKT
jgi:cysteine desulfurase/selenocysteine lyase